MSSTTGLEKLIDSDQEALNKVGFLNGTTVVHGGVSDNEFGAVLTPIYQSTTYVQESIDLYCAKGYSYTRQGNPTVSALERKIAVLEGVPKCDSDVNRRAVCFGSGIAATFALFSALLRTGDHVVMTNCSYGGTNRMSRVHMKNSLNIDFSFVDFGNLAAIEAAIIPGRTKVIFSETPCNPTLQLADVQAISELTQKYSKPVATDFSEIASSSCEEGDTPFRKCMEGRIVHVCDSTLSTPIILQPLMLGADIVLQSTTKFYDGHNSVTGGALIAKDAALEMLLRFYQNLTGAIMAPFPAYMMMQYAKTMELRIQRQSTSAMQVATFLETHPNACRVNYPGLPSHPHHKIALRQHQRDLHGALVGFDVVDGKGRQFMDRIGKPWTLCENLGASESIVTCPAVFTHANMKKEDREMVGITDGFVRLSVGLETPEDLIAALRVALDSI